MADAVYGKSLPQWFHDFPLLEPLVNRQPVCWFNPAVVPVHDALGDVPLTDADVADASQRLQRFAPFLRQAFPELAASHGIIESELVPVPAFAAAIARQAGLDAPSSVLLKLDSHLPVAGSVKARGGIYEVLYHAEQLALRHGLLRESDDYRRLLDDDCQQLFHLHKVAVGSTGNLGMSIGIASARLGFDTTVHMSADARQWKKDRLRAHGVRVVEYDGDYGQAVAQGRREAQSDPSCHFIDDENSTSLFLGYAVAGERLKAQFAAQGRVVDADHPLFVYLPCGVGGAPGGISFGLKLAFGDHVHCIFAEPTESPCMLMGVYTGLHDRLAVQDFGISNRTTADGLAVGRPSGFVGNAMQRLIDGYYTLTDEDMLALLHVMHETQQILLEPSALAGAPGFLRLLQENQGYRQRVPLTPQRCRQGTHVIWATGGGMVPEDEMARYLQAGAACRQSRMP
ncbi:D-serine ammonia-lyase [Dickeya fangzhongdai]|uniref:D-serine ammonia-lyase n=1 Tax=Dickeya fangzhongdai TaxID=1778540 RepID=UPI0004F7AAD9|nr:D-serine ammonia-lyase [Dickeya fangzhongdai]AIR70064.1 D-serine dehydratase [Dickeya fangzhongdai]KGT97562.1 D-serine dehydratase [Dickeya fangzhongdai]